MKWITEYLSLRPLLEGAPCTDFVLRRMQGAPVEMTGYEPVTRMMCAVLIHLSALPFLGQTSFSVVVQRNENNTQSSRLPYYYTYYTYNK